MPPPPSREQSNAKIAAFHKDVADLITEAKAAVKMGKAEQVKFEAKMANTVGACERICSSLEEKVQKLKRDTEHSMVSTLNQCARPARALPSVSPAP